MRIHRLFGFVLVFLITLTIPPLHGQETPVTLADQATALVRIVITRPGIEVLRHDTLGRWSSRLSRASLIEHTPPAAEAQNLDREKSSLKGE